MRGSISAPEDVTGRETMGNAGNDLINDINGLSDQARDMIELTLDRLTGFDSPRLHNSFN